MQYKSPEFKIIDSIDDIIRTSLTDEDIYKDPEDGDTPFIPGKMSF